MAFFKSKEDHVRRRYRLKRDLMLLEEAAQKLEQNEHDDDTGNFHSILMFMSQFYVYIFNL